MIHSDAGLVLMVIGWVAAFYGIRRRGWPATLVALAGPSIAEGALILREG